MRALITGITGQDGRYLSQLLSSKGYEVYGLVRNTNQTIPAPLISVYGDLTALPKLPEVDEVYNLAAMSHVGESFKSPDLAYMTNAIGAIRLMDWAVGIGAKFYQASTSEMFGNVRGPQDEETPMRPVSPYGNAKLTAHQHARMLREQGHFVCCGILFNHESPYRGANFVTQKIAQAAKRGERVTLGNLDAKRDWGHAEEYVEGMTRMMAHHIPDDYVLATGKMHSIRDLLQIAYGEHWSDYVSIDESYKRPAELHRLCGDASKAWRVLGWRAERTITEIMREMMT